MKKHKKNKKVEYYGQHELSEIQNKYFAQYDYNFWMHKANLLNLFIHNPEHISRLKFKGDIFSDEVIIEGLKMELHMTSPPLNRYLKFHCYKSPNLSKEQKKEWQDNAIKDWDNFNRSFKKNKKRNLDPRNPYQSNFELDEEGYRNLLQEFKREYHDDYNDFEEIWNSLDDEIKRDRSIVNNPKQVKA